MYVYCVYHAVSKGPKQLPNCLKIAVKTSVVLIVFINVTSELILFLFISVALHESGTRTALYSS